MKKIIFIAVFLLFIIQISGFFDWQTLKTEKFTLFYKKNFEKKALRLLASLEEFSYIPENIIDNKLNNLSVVLEDYGIYTNAFADPVYNNIYIINYDSGDLDWFTLAGIHEYTHILHLTKTEGMPKFFTYLFGNFLSPQIFSPMWMYEGITVYCESKINQFTGRLNDGGFDSYIATCIKENKFPSILKATYMPFEAPLGNTPYLFGGKFFSFLSEKYGEEKFKSFYKSYGGSLFSYLSPFFPWIGLDRTFYEVYGFSTEDLWKQWEFYEKEKNKDYFESGERITKYGFYVSYPVIYSDNLYFIRDVIDKNGTFSYKTRCDIIEKNLKTKEEKILFSTTTQIKHPLRFYNNKIYYLINEIKPGFSNRTSKSFGLISILVEKDLKTKEEKEIIIDEIRTFVIFKNKIIYVKDKKYDFGSEMFEFNLDTKENKKIFETDFYIYLLDTDEKNLYCVAKNQNENKGVYKINEFKKLDKLFNTAYVEDNISIYDNKIFFTSNYQKKYLLYCYDLKKRKIYRLTENGCQGFAAFDKQNNELFYVGLHSEGFDIYKIKPEFKEFKFKETEKEKINFELKEVEKLKNGNYIDNLFTLYPKIRLPLIYADYDANLSLGLFLNGKDAIGDFYYSLISLYNFEKKFFYNNLFLSTYLFSPLEIYLLYSNFNSKKIDMYGIGFNYVIYTSYKSGLNLMAFDIENNFYEELKKQKIIPELKIFFNYPELNIGFITSFIYENTPFYFKSKEGYCGKVIFSYFIPETKFTFLLDGFIGKNKNINNEIQIRGYKEVITGEKGLLFTSEISRNLFKIRQGFWNPVNIYLEDIAMKLFFDSVFNEKTNFYSYGIELHSETKFAFFVNLDIGVYVSLNKDKKVGYGIVLNTTEFKF